MISCFLMIATSTGSKISISTVYKQKMLTSEVSMSSKRRHHILVIIKETEETSIFIGFLVFYEVFWSWDFYYKG
jgi:hypothetical protein